MRIKNKNGIISFILNNLRYEDELELKALFGGNYALMTRQSLKNAKFQVLYGKDFSKNIVPVAIGDITEFSANSACVWLLSTKFISENKAVLVKKVIEELNKAEKKYNFLFNFIHSANVGMKRLLKQNGFSFKKSEKNPELEMSDEFEFFYKTRKE